MSGFRLGLSLIKVGDRRREDYGDIEALADSMREHGLLHPIVVDADDNLVAGGRRLRAAAQLGWESIPVTRLGDLTDAQLHEIELEENLERKDLTEAERSRNLVALVEIAKDSPDVSVPPRNGNPGRPAGHVPGSLRSVAERIGVSPQTILRAREHVAAVEEFPELEPLPQATAIRAAEQMRPVDPEADAAFAKGLDDIERAWKWDKALAKIRSLIRGFHKFGAADLVATWTDEERAIFARDLDRVIGELTEIRETTQEVIARVA